MGRATRPISEAKAIELLKLLFEAKQPSRRFEAKLPSRSGSLVLHGIGDDAAVLAWGKRQLVVSSDASVEHVHFDRRWLALEDIGYRAFMAAASDLAAMGARPIGALNNLVLPQAFGKRSLAQLARGQAAAAAEAQCPIIGGNLSAGGELSMTTVVLGDVRHAVLRSSAKPGDELWLLGEVGLSALGLRALQRGLIRSKASAVRKAIQAWRRPRALIAEGQRLVGRAHAAIDVSDGLANEAIQLARASQVQVLLHEQALTRALSASLCAGAAELGVSAFELALSGGEDYALLAAGPRARRPRGARVVGSVLAGSGAWLVLDSGKRRRLKPGFDHLGRSSKGG